MLEMLKKLFDLTRERMRQKDSQYQTIEHIDVFAGFLHSLRCSYDNFVVELSKKCGEAMVLHLGRDDPFKGRRVSDKLNQLLKDHYPGKISDLGEKVFARNLDHYAAAGKLEAFMDQFWVEFSCVESDKDTIHAILYDHCNKSLPNLIFQTRKELERLHCVQLNIPYRNNATSRLKPSELVMRIPKPRNGWAMHLIASLVIGEEARTNTRLQKAQV